MVRLAQGLEWPGPELLFVTTVATVCMVNNGSLLDYTHR
jgi:hypothetical protein